MQAIEIHSIHPHLWAIDEVGKTLMYVYEGTERVLLVDTGFGLTDLKAIIGELCPGKEIMVVNSHAHGDHNGGNNQFDKVYVGRMDEPASHKEIPEENRARTASVFFAPSNPRTQGIDKDAWRPGPAPKVIPLTDGDILDLGGIRLEVLETPGHTIGSVCLFDRENGYLFTGDMILTWEVWGQLDSSSSLVCYARSLERLAAMEGQVREIFPAHGVPDNPQGWPLYHLDPRTLTVYAEGTRSIVDGRTQGTPYKCFARDGLCCRFEIGGMVYDPARIGTDA